jgi:hypothetical protein
VAIFEKLICTLQERWKYLLGYYVFGYLISLMQSGVPNLYYLIPLKTYAILFSLALGNADYSSSIEAKRRKVVRLPVQIYFFNAVKYGIPAMIMTFIYYFSIVIISGIFKFDSAPFIAP